MIYELNHVGVFIRDLDASLSFYIDTLGGKIVSQAIIPATNTDCVYLQIAGGMIELLRRAEPPADMKFGLNHIGFMTDDLDGDHRRLTDAGYTFLVAPKVAGTGRGRLAFLSDPNGARIELLQRAEEFRIPAITDGPIRGLDHLAIAAPDLQGAEEFYQRHLGMKHLTTMRVEQRDLTMSYFHFGDDVVELLHRPTPPEDDNVFGHIALRVDNVDELLANLAEKGVPVDPGTPKPAGTGYGRIGIIRDPDGVKVELLDRADLREL